MPVLSTSVDPRSPSYVDNRAAMLARLAELDQALSDALSGGGEKYVSRHHARGKLLARERIELLVDQDSPFLELCPLAAWGTDFSVGASVVTGIGVVEGVPCMVIANDPTTRGGAVNPYSLKKTQRAGEIARTNRLPLVNLVESAGADLPTQAEIFIPGGGVYVPGMSDYTIFVKDRAKVFLAGPPLVRMATGEVTDDESLGGAAMHATRSGLADFVAEDERDGIRLARMCLRRATRAHETAAVTDATRASAVVTSPKHDPEDLLGIPSADLRMPFDPREILARVLDGSELDEFKPAYGTALCTGWGAIHGHPIGVLANVRGILFSAEAQKAAQFIQLANASGTPLLFLQNTTGYMVGTEYEQAGIIKHGALMINAVANSAVPHLTVNIGASYGAGNYGMCGRAYEPRFLFTWPNAKSAVMGPTQLAGVLSIVARQAAEAKGQPYDEEADASMRAMVEQRIEQESAALFLSGRLYDDGVIDPRDTRTVLGFCLSIINSGPAEARYGVFRM